MFLVGFTYMHLTSVLGQNSGLIIGVIVELGSIPLQEMTNVLSNIKIIYLVTYVTK